MSIEKPKENLSANKSYWLTDEASQWVEDQAAKDDRSASNFIERLIRKEMARAKRRK